jgi:type II secretory pathway component PulC
MAVQNELAALTAKRQPSMLYSGGVERAKSRAVKFDSFNVPEKNLAETAAAKNEEDKETEASPKPIDSFKLVGTLPAVGAWVTVEKTTELILRRQEFNGYILESIEPQRVLFTRDGENFPLYMVYSSPPSKPVMVKPVQEAAAANQGEPSPPPSAQTDQGGIMLAGFNGDEGTVTRELLNSLLMNPYAEIAKMRLIPTDSGMRIAGLRSDALFAKLGVKRNDVITGINGIEIKDVSNFANVISSLLTGARLDFQVARDGEPGQLGYAVK